MTLETDIKSFGFTPEQARCAERISLLLESALLDSAWVDSCNATLEIAQLSTQSNRLIVKGNCFGAVNGREFSFPFEQDWVIDDDTSLNAWMRSPVVAFILVVFRSVRGATNAEKTAQDWMTRSEFEIAAKLETEISQLIEAPKSKVKSLRRKALVLGTLSFLIAASIMTAYAYANPHPRRLGDGPAERLLVAMLAGGLLSGVPAFLGGIFLGLLFVDNEVENTTAGQALLRMVGVKSITGIRMLSLIGVIVGFGLAAGSILMLMRSR